MKASKRLEIVPVTAAELITLYGRAVSFPVIAHAAYARRGRRKPVLVGFGGLAWRFPAPDGLRMRCDIWVTIKRPDLVNPVTLVRWARRMLRTAAQVGETSVYCLRDDDPNSAKLLELVGLQRLENVEISFEDGSKRTGEVWRWQVSQQSQP